MKETSRDLPDLPDQGSVGNALPANAREEELRELVRENERLARALEDAEERREQNEKTMLLQFLEAADAFDPLLQNIAERLADAPEQARIWAGNIRGIYKRLGHLLERLGLEPVEAAPGTRVDPYVHSITETVEMPDREDDTIAVEEKKGYRWKGGLLRPASVTSVKNRAKATGGLQ